MSFLDPEKIAVLAELYDQFAHALDPFAPNRDEAEKHFTELLSQHYEELVYNQKIEFVTQHGSEKLFTPAITLRDYRRAVIGQCRAYLKANR